MRKSFDDKLVLNDIDLDITDGTVFALLGPNGAGKTTAVRILCTLSRPDAGRAWIAGKELASEPDAARAAIGVTGQSVAVDGLLTGFENLVLIGKLHHLGKREARQRATELLEKFDLTGAADQTLSTYSGGMRRKLDLAMTLVGRPRIIFLDEPTTGLDPRSRRTMWQIIRDLVREHGVTIFLTTQYLEEADQLADRIAVLDQGRLVQVTSDGGVRSLQTLLDRLTGRTSSRPGSSCTRPTWLGAAGLAALTAWALTWVALAMGLSAKAPEAASNLPMPFILQPFLGSGFVPAASMSPGLRQFAEYQPFTPITQTLRGLLLGTPAGNQWIYALAWCAGLSLAGYLASRRLFDRRAER